MANYKSRENGNGSAGDTAASKLSGAYETAKEKASEVMDAAKSSTSDAMEAVQNVGTVAYAQGKDTLKNIAGSAGEAVTSTIEEQKTAGAEALAKAARSVRESAEGFEKDAPQVAGLIKSAATSVESFSTGIKDKTLSDLMNDMSDFAERRPLTFLAAGIIGGLIVTRMLSSSSSSNRS